ncbi:M14 family zinc carboxypeptidase [Paenibacillus sp. MABNR03]|uniref:M14 family zinc carboxypeptidase n=1 Tax=Paenibacillus sp. MABNR03 TaxID=3142626 RepID=UPI003D2BE5D5
MNIEEVIGRVPDYETFMTIDEMDESTRKLAWDYPDVVTVFEAGTSREGHSILGIKVGNGPLNAVCFACPHPNEPIGAMTMEFLSRELAENAGLREELGFTWYIIKCIDPDGFRLNEGWIKGPYTIYNYMRHFYRPIGYEQVEWTFPVDYKELHFDNPLPETQAVMRLIQEKQPAFLYSLHNAGFGGAYWYISEDMPEIYDDLRAAAEKQDVALNLGEPEAPFLTEFSPAVFQTMGIAQEYNYVEQNTGEPPVGFNCGTSSGDYASAHAEGCVTLLAELPYFFDARVQDLRLSNISRRDAVHANVDRTTLFLTKVDELLQPVRPYITEENRFIKLVNMSLDHMKQGGAAKKNWADSLPEFQEAATFAQLFDNVETAAFYNGLSLALSLRAVEFEIERLERDGTDTQEALSLLQHARHTASDFLIQHCEELESRLDYSVIPIQKLVRIQTESGLIVTKRIHERSQQEIHN